MSDLVRIYCTIPLDKAEAAVERGDAVWFGLFPAAMRKMIDSAERPRMSRVGTLPQPTADEMLRWALANRCWPKAADLQEPATFVLAASEECGRDVSDVVHEMLGGKKIAGGEFPSLNEHIAANGGIVSEDAMICAFVPLENNSPTNPDEWFSRPRCERCNWPLADSEENGCVAGNCSMRGAQ